MTLPPHPSLVVLTGAGISAESGVRTFRDGNGLWEEHRIEDVATPEGFARNPALVHRFYNARRRQLREVRPNLAHLALARLEAALPGEVLVVTQNVDDLHDRAGSKALVHMHGELLKARCTVCGAVVPWADDLSLETPCPACAQRGGLRPHIVWFGEMPLEMPYIAAVLGACRRFVAIGTSGQVYPAAGFVEMVGPRARTLELNLEPSAVSAAFQEVRLGRAAELVPAWVEEQLTLA